MARLQVLSDEESVLNAALEKIATEDEEALEHVPAEQGPPTEEELSRGSLDEDVESVIASGDMDAVRDFLAASMDQERKALNALVKWTARVEPKTTELMSAYLGHQRRTNRLFSIAMAGLVKPMNGVA